jgi:hypothetical protein
MQFGSHAIIDGDGHVVEDFAAIVRLMPRAYQDLFADRPSVERSRPFDPFPPLDHLHSFPNLFCHLHGGAFGEVGPDGWLEFLDDVGIQTTVLYTTRGLAFGKILSRDWAIDLARAYNDWFEQNYLQRSPRFKGMALIPLQEPEAAVAELRRAVKEIGLCGALLPSTGFQSHLGHKRYWPIYEEADRLGCCLTVHGGAHENLGMDDLHPYAPVNALGHPFSIMLAFASLIFNGVFDRFPKLRVGFMEAGVAWLLLCLERFDRSYETHVPYDLRGEFLKLKPKERVSDYIAARIGEGRIFIGCEGSESELPLAIARVGRQPFIFSSDFPHEVNNEYCKNELAEIQGSEELTAEDKKAILFDNARRFYGLTANVR